jgi:hypothetical protein
MIIAPESTGLPLPSPGFIKRSRPRPRKIEFIQILSAVLGCSVILILVLCYQYERQLSTFELVDSLRLPREPSVVLESFRRKSTWTVWIPPESPFPLMPWQYAEICSQIEEITSDSYSKSSLFGSRPAFADVEAAIQSGLLPSNSIHSIKMPHTADFLDISQDNRSICKSSLTFILESNDAGMGSSLLNLWLAQGIAKEENRAFFVDDTRWAYGNYSSYFRPPPDTGCRPAPATHRIPCSSSAAHRVISAATLLSSRSSMASTPMYKQHQLMRVGYETLFHLADEGDALSLLKIKDQVLNETRARGGIAVGLHIRRGDVHPQEAIFQGDYIPLTRYVYQGQMMLDAQYRGDKSYLAYFSSWISHKARLDVKRELKTGSGVSASRLLVASDDPLVFDSAELKDAARAQGRFRLATKADLEAMIAKAKSPLDTLHGWDGGFYRSVFMSLGVPDHKTAVPPGHAVLAGASVESYEHRRLAEAALHADAQSVRQNGWTQIVSLEPPSQEALAMRTLIGRGYVLDLAVLGQCDAIICGISSSACRILGVMAGWSKIQAGLWQNLDGHDGWIGIQA